MTKPKFDMVDPAVLRANPWNTNRMTAANEAKLEESLKQFKEIGGFFKPIVVRDTPTGLEILGGEHRWEVSQRLGYLEVPIFNLGPIDDIQAKKISIIDNARYGVDDGMALADLLKDIGTTEDLESYLPYSEADLTSIFHSDFIALDDLELEESEELNETIPEEEKIAKVPKTHTIMRFKVSLGDAEKITALIASTQTDYGFTTSDEMTNAGDALVHLLITESAA